MTKFNLLSVTAAAAIAFSSVTAFAADHAKEDPKQHNAEEGHPEEAKKAEEAKK